MRMDWRTEPVKKCNLSQSNLFLQQVFQLLGLESCSLFDAFYLVLRPLVFLVSVRWSCGGMVVHKKNLVTDNPCCPQGGDTAASPRIIRQVRASLHRRTRTEYLRGLVSFKPAGGGEAKVGWSHYPLRGRAPLQLPLKFLYLSVSTSYLGPNCWKPSAVLQV